MEYSKALKEIDDIQEKNSNIQTKLLTTVSWGGILFLFSMTFDYISNSTFYVKIVFSVLIFLFTTSMFFEFFICMGVKSMLDIASKARSIDEKIRDEADEAEKAKLEEEIVLKKNDIDKRHSRLMAYQWIRDWSFLISLVLTFIALTSMVFLSPEKILQQGDSSMQVETDNVK